MLGKMWFEYRSNYWRRLWEVIWRCSNCIGIVFIVVFLSSNLSSALWNICMFFLQLLSLCWLLTSPLSNDLSVQENVLLVVSLFVGCCSLVCQWCFHTYIELSGLKWLELCKTKLLLRNTVQIQCQCYIVPTDLLLRRFQNCVLA